MSTLITKDGVQSAQPTQVTVDLPEPLGYRIKNRLLGSPLVTEQLDTERLGTFVGMGVLTPDAISSSAYGTEEMLVELVPYVGLAAFALADTDHLDDPAGPVLRHAVLQASRHGVHACWRFVRSGPGELRPTVAQIAAVALLIDYTVTVAVQTAAGTDALVSAFPALLSYDVPISVAVVVLIAYGNLRGIREAGRLFAIPTYFFIFCMAAVIITGLVREALGNLPQYSIHREGLYPFGHPGSGLLMGASVIVIMRSFANGGSSLTGVEAISNGVSAFKPPEGTRARHVYVLMSCTLGVLVLGISLLARWTHAAPFVAGAPTVIAQEAQAVFGWRGRERPVLRSAARHPAHPLYRREHELQWFSVPGQLRRG